MTHCHCEARRAKAIFNTQYPIWEIASALRTSQ